MSFIFIDLKNILQVLHSSLPLLIVDLCASYLLDHHLLILKLFLGCDCKFSVGHIRTRHTDLLPPQVCSRLWWGWRFFISPVSINTLIGFKAVPRVWQFLEDCWWFIYKHQRRFFILLSFYIYKHHRILFLLLGFYIYKYKHHKILFLFGILYISVSPGVTKYHCVNPCIFYVGLLAIDL